MVHSNYENALAWRSGDPGFEMADGILLLGDDPIHEVADGDHPDYLAVIKNGQVPEAALGDDAHAFADGVIGEDSDHRAGHDFRHCGVFGRAALKDDFAGIIALGNDAEQSFFFHHQQRANALLRHHGDSVVDGSRWGKGPDSAALALDQGSDFATKFHQHGQNRPAGK